MSDDSPRPLRVTIAQVAWAVTALLLANGPARAQVGDSYKVQTPQLAAPERGSLVGSLARTAFAPQDLVRGAVSLPSPYAAPQDRGPLLADIFPVYSPEAGISEWGMGWAVDLALTRWRASGTDIYASEDLSGPFGRCVKGADGNWYPVGLGKLVRIEPSGSGFLAYTSDGTRWRFGVTTRITAAGTYAWFLDEVESVTGKKTALTYEKNGSGRPFLKQVDFGGVGTAFEHRVTFDYASLSKTFSDYRPGIALVLDRRVSGVTAWTRHAVTRTFQPRWSYAPTYRADPVGPAFYLANVAQTFASGEKAPATSYTYELSPDVLSSAALVRTMKFDAVAAKYGGTSVLPSYSTPVDAGADGLQDLEIASDNTLVVQDSAGFSYQPLPPRTATARPECRAAASAFNVPRTLAAMRASSDELQVVSLTAATNTRLLLCDRAGEPLHETTLSGVWTLGPKTRLVDLNRDHGPDLIRVYSNGYAVIPNTSTSTSFSFGAPIFGRLNLAFPFDGIWVHDFNGDGLPDIITRTSSLIVVYFGIGNYKFDPTPRTYPVLNFQGQTISPSTYAFTWVDADHDGLVDLILSTQTSAFLFRNSGSAFVPVLIGGNTSVGVNGYLPLFTDLNGSGNAEVFFLVRGAGYSVALSSAATGLLRSADDGKGTVLRFEYRRADPAPGIGRRPAVVSRVVVESSGYDAFAQDFAYGTPRMHSVGKFLVGFDQVSRVDPVLTEQASFLNADSYAGVLVSSTRHDSKAPLVDAYESRSYEDAVFQGIPWKRLKQTRSGFVDAAGENVSTQADYAAYVDEVCPEAVVRTDPSGVLTTTKGYARPAAFGNALSCVWTSAVEQGSHPDPSLDFTHQTVLTRNALGLVEKVESVAGTERLVLQTATYRPDDWQIDTVSSPGKGTTAFEYDDAATRLLASVTTPDGVVVRALTRDSLHDGILTLQTTRGSVSYEQYFSFDGQERLASRWDNLGASTNLNPVARYAYQYGSAAEPAAVYTSTLIDAAWASARDTVDLLDAVGQPVATATRIPEGWAFGGLVSRSRAAATTRHWVRPTLGPAADPMALDYATLLSGASQVGSEVASAYGHDAEGRTTYHEGVERKVTKALALSGGLLLLSTLENDTNATFAWMDSGKRVLAWDDEAGVRTVYTYDVLGRLREVTLPNGGKHRALYDGHGRVWRIERDGVAAVEYAFDPANGLPSTRSYFTHAKYQPANALVRSIAYGYDDIGRVKTEIHTLAAGGPAKAFSFFYDGATPSQCAAPAKTTLGLLTGVTGDGYAKAFDYRADGKLTRRLLCLGTWRQVETSFEYLEGAVVGGRTVRILDGAGAQISSSQQSFRYDGSGRLASVRLNGGLLATLGYDGNGLLSSAALADGGSLTLSHDPLTRRVTGAAQTTPSFSAATALRLDARGLVGSESFTVGTTSLTRGYAYSAQRFLTGAADAQSAYGYGFDGFGLPTSVTKNGATRAITETGNSLTAGTVTYTFDGLHRTVSRATAGAPSQTLTLEYGADGQLATATKVGGTFTFVHDEAGQRLVKLAGGTPVAAYLDEGFLDAFGLTERFQIGGRTVGLIQDGVLTAIPTDLRGTVMAEPTGEAAIASPFGQRDVHPVTAAAIDYVEKGFDSDLGLVRMGVRDYDPEINRFTTADPLFLENPQKCLESTVECNLYGYARNAPNVFVDPSGEQVVPPGAPGVPRVGPSVRDPGLARLEEFNRLSEELAARDPITRREYIAPRGWRPTEAEVEQMRAQVTTLRALQEAPSVLQATRFNRPPPATSSPLDWSIVSRTGETREAHVNRHGVNNLAKEKHGVFYGDPVRTVNEAWEIARQKGIEPVRTGREDIYLVPRPNSGWQGGAGGQGHNLDSVTIVTRPGTNQVITAFPGNGIPNPQP